MKYIFFIFFVCFVFPKLVLSNHIIFGASGIAKVGNSCFLSFFIKNQSSHNILELEFDIFATDIEKKLIGNSNITLNKLNKNQPFTASIPIEMKNDKKCKAITNVNVLSKKCTIRKQLAKNCKGLIKTKENLKKNFLISTSIISNGNFYKSDNNKSYLEEFGIYLKVMNLYDAQKYKIKNKTSGLIVVHVNDSNTFLEGDLIVEAEMNEIINVPQLKTQLKIINERHKEHILINFIRNNNEKLVAVKLN